MPRTNESGTPKPACQKLMFGIYHETTICARPQGHVGKHSSIYDPREWEDKRG